MDEVRCPKCLSEMKEYATRFICRNLACRLEYKKIFTAGEIKADGIAQGRREAADIACEACGPSEKQRSCGFYCNGGDESYSCKTRRTMLGAVVNPQSKSWQLAEELLKHIKCGDLRCYSCEMRAKAILGTASNEKGEAK